MSQVLEQKNVFKRTPYFVIDGPEGIGKSTFIPKFKKYLEEKGYEVVTVREPGETEAGKILRPAIFEKDLGFDKNLELFLSDRILTQQLVVLPALRDGKIVLSDRSLLTSCVYQGLIADDEIRLPKDSQTNTVETRSMLSKVLKTHSCFRDFLYPTVGLIPQLDFDVCLARLHNRQDNKNWLDRQPESWHRAVHQHFANAVSWAPCPIEFIDFNKTEPEILNQAFSSIEYFLPPLNK